MPLQPPPASDGHAPAIERGKSLGAYIPSGRHEPVSRGISQASSRPSYWTCDRGAEEGDVAALGILFHKAVSIQTKQPGDEFALNGVDPYPLEASQDVKPAPVFSLAEPTEGRGTDFKPAIHSSPEIASILRKTEHWGLDNDVQHCPDRMAMMVSHKASSAIQACDNVPPRQKSRFLNDVPSCQLYPQVEHNLHRIAATAHDLGEGSTKGDPERNLLQHGEIASFIGSGESLSMPTMYVDPGYENHHIPTSVGITERAKAMASRRANLWGGNEFGDTVSYGFRGRQQQQTTGTSGQLMDLGRQRQTHESFYVGDHGGRIDVDEQMTMLEALRQARDVRLQGHQRGGAHTFDFMAGTQQSKQLHVSDTRGSYGTHHIPLPNVIWNCGDENDRGGGEDENARQVDVKARVDRRD